MGSAIADGALDAFENVTHLDPGADVLDGPLAAIFGDARGLAVTIDGVGVHGRESIRLRAGCAETLHLSRAPGLEIGKPFPSELRERGNPTDD